MRSAKSGERGSPMIGDMGNLWSRLRRCAGAMALTAVGLTAFAAAAGASGAPGGPPAGPTSPPFYQCPAIGYDTTCQFLVDVTSTNPAVAPTVLEDPAQSFYDGSDDVTVAIQNDSTGPISSVHLGVEGTGDSSFSFDGDGLCNPGSGPSPDGCPFGPAGNNGDPFDYYGPDTTLTPDPSTTDSGTVDFTTPLQPGQYTYVSLEAPLSTPIIYAGSGNTGIQTTLTDTTSGTTVLPAPVITTAAPAAVTDTATLVGPKVSTATGTVTYKVYSDPTCQKEVATGGTKPVTAGTAEASDEVGISPRALANNASYYWQASYSGDGTNSPVTGACGNEVMTFGTPPSLPAPTIATALAGGGQVGTRLMVPSGTAVTDNATITAPGGQPVSGRLSYEVYSTSTCSPFSQVQGAGGGLTSGSGPASNPLTLPSGTYYFQASYSGNGSLSKAVSACGSEVLTVAAPSPPPPPPNSLFTSVGNPQLNAKTGQLLIVAQFPAPGTATSNGVVQQGATLARVHQALAEAARRAKKCKRGFVKKHKKCVNNGPALYGVSSLTIPAAGTYTIVINPTSKVLKALKTGKKLNVVVSTTFQNRAGGVPVTHIQDVLVKLKLHKRGHHKRH